MTGDALLSIALAFLGGCAAPPPLPSPAGAPFDRAAAIADVARVLDDLHDAAAHADEARYFAHFAQDGVFLGTDATERWELAAFRAYAHPRFAKGQGWTYRVVRRAVDFSSGHDVAWFDEDLAGERAGPCRGSGVLVKQGGAFRIAQYNLAFTIPNDRFDAMRAALDPSEPHLRHEHAYAEAGEAVASGDLVRGRDIVVALLPDAKARPDDDLELRLHEALIWLRWNEGDLDAAVAEVRAAMVTIDHALLPKEKADALRLRVQWEQAYLQLELAMHAPKDRTEVELGVARGLKAVYDGRASVAEAEDTLGRLTGDHDAGARVGDHARGAALAAAFAVQRGDARAAAAAARSVDIENIEKDEEPQVLYLMARALEASGNRPAADRVRARVCGGHEALLTPLLVRALGADGHPCAGH